MSLESQKQKVQEKVKQLNPSLDDFVVAFSIDTVFDDVAIYCNIELDEIPDQLLTTITLMAGDLISKVNLGKTDEQIEDASVQSIKEGDVTVTKLSPADMIKRLSELPSLSTDYHDKLNRFRRVKNGWSI